MGRQPTPHEPQRPVIGEAQTLPDQGLHLKVEEAHSRHWDQEAGGAGTAHVGRAARLNHRLGMISATMLAGLPTIADLRRAGRISSQEVVAAIDLYMRDSAAGPYRFASGHSLDIAALVNASLVLSNVDRSRPMNAGVRTALAAAIMAARPTLP